MKPAVLFVHSNSELYGADFILLQVVCAIKDRLRPIVALPGEGALTERLQTEGVQFVLTGDSILRRNKLKPFALLGFLLSLAKDVSKLSKIVRQENVQLVYSNTSAVISGALTARRCRIPHLYHVHEIIQAPPWLARTISRLVLGNSSEVIAVSNAVSEALQRFGKPGDPPVRVIHNGLDSSRFDGVGEVESLRRELGAGPENVLYGVIGRIHPWKGQRYFIEAARLVADVCPRARFVIIGGTFSGYEHLVDDLNSLVRRLALNHRLKILPHRTDIPRLMKALDVFVLPSTSPDPLPTVVLEAMAAARPVVATAHGGVVEMVLHGETGLLTPFNDVAMFSQTLLQLADSAELRGQMGRWGRERVEQSFGLDRFSREIQACLAAYLPPAMAEVEANLELT